MKDILKKLYGDVVTEESLATFNEELGKRFVSKTDFNQRSDELKSLRERHMLLEAEQKAGLEAKEEAELLKKSLREEKERHAKEMENFILQEQEKYLAAALDRELTASGARNLTAVKALLDMSRVSVDDNGILTGLSEQIWELKKDNNFLFKEEEEKLQFIRPVARTSDNMSREEFQKMGYMERLKMKKEQPDLYQLMKQK